MSMMVMKLCHPSHIPNQIRSRGRSRLPNSRPFQDPGSGQEPPPGQLWRHLRRAHVRSKLFKPAGCHGCVPAGGPGQPGQVIVIMRMMWLRIKMMTKMIILWERFQSSWDGMETLKMYNRSQTPQIFNFRVTERSLQLPRPSQSTQTCTRS